MKPSTLAAVKDGAYIAGAMPYIEDDINKALRAIDHRAQANSPITPELALVLWTERLCYINLLAKLKQRVVTGVSLAGNIQAELEF